MKEKMCFALKGIIVAVLAFVLCYSQILYSVDKIFADKLYQTVTSTDRRIKIIAIDERTMQEYGGYEDLES